MGTDNNNKIKALFEILLGGFAIFAIKSILKMTVAKLYLKKDENFFPMTKKWKLLIKNYTIRKKQILIKKSSFN